MPSFVINELKSPVAVVCHDAGAANHIVAFMKANRNYDFRPAMFGPARKIWDAAFPTGAIFDSIENVLAGSKVLLSGTGWQTPIEHLARKAANEAGIMSIAVLDHWVNYKERFNWKGDVEYPNEFWVFDQYAFEIANKTFPNFMIRELPNLYLDDLVGQIPKARLETSDILYILEPIRDNWGSTLSGEFQALDFFYSKLDSIPFVGSGVIRLRPHPSEGPEKYSKWITRYVDLNIQIDQSSNLSEAISMANCVVGCESYALVIALHAGKKVYSSLPANAPPFRLPYAEIIELRKL